MARFYIILLVLLVLFSAVVLSWLPEYWWKYLRKKRDVSPLKLALWERSRYIRRCMNAFLAAALFFVGTAIGLILSDRFYAGAGSGNLVFLLFSLGFPVLTGLSVITGFYYLVLALKKPAAEAAGLPAFLIDAPGPFPWYLSRKPVRHPSKKVELFWDTLVVKSGREVSAGALKSLAGEVYGLISPGVCVKPGSGSRFLVWDQGKTAADGTEKEMVRLRVIETASLVPLPDPESGLKEMEASGGKIYFPGGEAGSVLIPALLREGIYSREFPPAFHEFGELMLFVTMTPRNRGWRREDLKLWIANPAVGTLEVIDQEWFGASLFARGKQVPVRVARDPVSGAICCEVIRLGIFTLNESKKKIRDFIIDDRHYTPQGISSRKKAVNSASK